MKTIEQIRLEIFDLRQKIKEKLDEGYNLTYLANAIGLKKTTLFAFYKVEVKDVTNIKFLKNLEKISLFFNKN